MKSIVAQILILFAIMAVVAEFQLSACLAQQPQTAAFREANVLVVLIGGMDSDPTAAQIQNTARRHEGNSGMFRLQRDLKHDRIVSHYFNWNGTRAGKIQAKPTPGPTAIIETIRGHLQRHPQSRVIIVGNSWGGHTAWQVCQEIFDSPQPVAIDCVMFLDPSSAGRSAKSRPVRLPLNVARSVNYHTRNLFGWRSWPNEERMENIDLGDRKHGFLVDGGPAYDSAFNFEAHVAAEWDERLHADICKRIHDLIPKSDTSAN
ncbi:MAG: hypothetical protein JWM11_1801 [Planctomycetaceae bacterium]|nr:hypothetical protein [Planctomycetaceae bacterium]